MEEWLEGLKKADASFKVLGTDSNSPVSLDDARIGRPVALILGNEAKGVSLRLKGFVDTMIKIPMIGTVDSLNVACAASICIHKIFSNS